MATTGQPQATGRSRTVTARRSRRLVAGLSAVTLLTGGVVALTALPAGAATVTSITVTSLGDGADPRRDGVCATSAGDCTLRAALQEANASSAHATIGFALPGTGTQTIRILSKLPNLTNPLGMTIDGFTQPGSVPNTDELADNAVVRVEVRGQGSVGAGAFDGFGITSPDNVVRGLAVYDFAKAFNLAGDGADRNQLIGNFICTDATGTFQAAKVSTKSFGVLMTSGASANRIGMPGSENRNVISGCAHRGVSMSFATSGTSGTVDNKVQNNIVGLNPAGTAALGNLAHGIDVNYTRSNLIGGDGYQERNVISGNKSTGVEVSHGRGTHDNAVVGNLIGTDVTGNAAPAYAANGQWGLRLEGPKHCDPCTEAAVSEGLPYGNLARGNVIAGNKKGGILLDKGQNHNTIGDNLIGLTADGTRAPNGFFGIRIEHGAFSNTVGPGNVIAYNPKGITSVPTGYAPPGAEQPTFDNRWTQNSWYGSSGLGIDLAPLGSADDAGGSALVNGGIRPPVLTGSTPASVTGTTCAGCTVEAYVADATKAGVYGDGREYLGTTVAGGDGTFTVTFTDRPGAYVTAFATARTTSLTSTDGGSSEFAKNIKLP